MRWPDLQEHGLAVWMAPEMTSGEQLVVLPVIGHEWPESVPREALAGQSRMRAGEHAGTPAIWIDATDGLPDLAWWRDAFPSVQMRPMDDMACPPLLAQRRDTGFAPQWLWRAGENAPVDAADPWAYPAGIAPEAVAQTEVLGLTETALMRLTDTAEPLTFAQGADEWAGWIETHRLGTLLASEPGTDPNAVKPHLPALAWRGRVVNTVNLEDDLLEHLQAQPEDDTAWRDDDAAWSNRIRQAWAEHPLNQRGDALRAFSRVRHAVLRERLIERLETAAPASNEHVDLNDESWQTVESTAEPSRDTPNEKEKRLDAGAVLPGARKNVDVMIRNRERREQALQDARNFWLLTEAHSWDAEQSETALRQAQALRRDQYWSAPLARADDPVDRQLGAAIAQLVQQSIAASPSGLQRRRSRYHAPCPRQTLALALEYDAHLQAFSERTADCQSVADWRRAFSAPAPQPRESQPSAPRYLSYEQREGDWDHLHAYAQEYVKAKTTAEIVSAVTPPSRHRKLQETLGQRLRYVLEKWRDRDPQVWEQLGSRLELTRERWNGTILRWKPGRAGEGHDSLTDVLLNGTFTDSLNHLDTLLRLNDDHLNDALLEAFQKKSWTRLGPMRYDPESRPAQALSVQDLPDSDDGEADAETETAKDPLAPLREPLPRVSIAGLQETPWPHFQDLVRRGPERRPDHADISEEDLMTRFGLRGIQYGNWVNQKERQAMLNLAYDSLEDMREALGVEPSFMGFYGRLGLALGAQGKGGRTAAHYLRGQDVINLTKTKGGGAFAHEWSHAFDNLLGRLVTGQNDAMLSSQVKVDRSHWERTRHAPLETPALQQIRMAMQHYIRGIHHGVTSEASRTEDEQRDRREASARQIMNDLTQRMMTPKILNQVFDSVDYDLVGDLRHPSPYLQEFRAKMGLPVKADENPQAIQEARQTVWNFLSTLPQQLQPAVDRWAQAIDSVGGNLGDELFERTGNPYRYSKRFLTERMAETIQKHRDAPLSPLERHTLQNWVSTAGYQRWKTLYQRSHRSGHQHGGLQVGDNAFYRGALLLDKGRANAYWSTPFELLARGFSASVHDWMSERHVDNEFCSRYSAPEVMNNALYAASPNPEGAERQRLHAVADELRTVARYLDRQFQQHDGRLDAVRQVLVQDQDNQQPESLAKNLKEGRINPELPNLNGWNIALRETVCHARHTFEQFVLRARTSPSEDEQVSGTLLDTLAATGIRPTRDGRPITNGDVKEIAGNMLSATDIQRSGFEKEDARNVLERILRNTLERVEPHPIPLPTGTDADLDAFLGNAPREKPPSPAPGGPS